MMKTSAAGKVPGTEKLGQVFVPDLFLTKAENDSLEKLSKSIEWSIRLRDKFPWEQTYLRLSLQHIGRHIERLQSTGIFMEALSEQVYKDSNSAVSLVGKASMCIQFIATQSGDVSAELAAMISRAMEDGWEENKRIPLLFCAVFEYAYSRLMNQRVTTGDVHFELIRDTLAANNRKTKAQKVVPGVHS